MLLTPFESKHRGLALALVLFTLAICISLAMQLYAITHAQRQTLFSYGLAARRLLTHHQHTQHLRQMDIRGTGQLGRGWAHRRYRRAYNQADDLSLDCVELRINASFPKFHFTTLQLKHRAHADLNIVHIGAWP